MCVCLPLCVCRNHRTNLGVHFVLYLASVSSCYLQLLLLLLFFFPLIRDEINVTPSVSSLVPPCSSPKLLPILSQPPLVMENGKLHRTYHIQTWTPIIPASIHTWQWAQHVALKNSRNMFKFTRTLGRMNTLVRIFEDRQTQKIRLTGILPNSLPLL